MTEPDLPWVPGAIRALLLADLDFTAACQGRAGTRLPADMTKPYAQIRIPAPGADMGGGGYRPLVQVDGWAAPGNGEDPERVAWRIAVRAARVLRYARNISYESMHYTPRVIDGPMATEDTTRGTASPLYRALIRAELTIHNQ